MKKYIFLLLFFLCLFTSNVSAKVSTENRTLTNDNIVLLKGYLFDLTRKDAVVPINLRNHLPNIVNAVSWLEEQHDVNQVFKLEEINNNNSVIVKTAINNINDFINSDFPAFLIEATMINWGNLGLRVDVVHLEKTLTLSFRLRPFPPHATKHLVYRHNEQKAVLFKQDK